MARMNHWMAAHAAHAALAALAALAVLIASDAAAQAGARPRAAKQPISDNSFLMEEAYNQEAGVVQHISLFQKARDGQAWSYAFTQEWPVGGQRHQFSYTVPFARISPNQSGFGDVMLNWRYQAVGGDDAPTWVAPRLSLVLPTGDRRKGLGTSVLGVQGAIPVSHRLGDQLVAHTNAGVTLLPGAKDTAGKSGTATTLTLGQSLIWQPFARTNFMLEAVWAGTSRAVGAAGSWNASFYVSPGVRWAYDYPTGLQVVPGIAFPIGVGPSKHDNQVLLYLSFEHPFGTPR